MQNFGEMNWNDEVFPGDNDKRKANNKDLFLRLNEGTNELRILTQPFQYLVHKYKKNENDPGFGRKIQCSAINGSCPLCDLGDKAKPRWLLGVISRKDNTYKIMDISWSVFDKIRKLNRNPKIGDPTKYDVNIEVDKNGGATGYYTVQSLQKEPLSAEDQLIKDKIDFDDLKRRVTPPTHEQVQKYMDKIDGTNQSNNSNSNSKKTTAPAAKSTAKSPAPAPVNTTGDDEDFDAEFPAHDAQ